jgi:hypothetical protein
LREATVLNGSLTHLWRQYLQEATAANKQAEFFDDLAQYNPSFFNTPDAAMHIVYARLLAQREG